MEEIRWQHGMEEYRAVQHLVRDGRYQEALERAHQALLRGGLGRRNAARLNSLLCWAYISGLEQPSPVAILYGEEAVRLAELCSDAWIRCEALARLVPAYCQVGDLTRAEQACEALARELRRNRMVIPGGLAALWLLRSLVALAKGEEHQARLCLDRAKAKAGEDPDLLRRIDEHRQVVEALEEPNRAADGQAGRLIQSTLLEGDGARAARVRWLTLAALQVETTEPDSAKGQAKEALHQAIALGRVDLAHLVRRRLAHLLG